LPIKKIEQYLATGRRKSSIARVFLRPGSGKITVNGRAFDQYFPTDAGRIPAKFPLTVVDMVDRFDIVVLANGGGVAGQSGAIRLGIARALVEFNAELRGPLKKAGLLTRDPREHERKKYGQKGARKRFQFSKR
jgi:small subunit ribosomal protein S9